MKILVLSDSHSALSFMRRCISYMKPDVVIHLGDYYEDGSTIGFEYPEITFYQVPGNCDRYRHGCDEPEILVKKIGGIWFYITHGHRHNVKLFTAQLLKDARANHVQVALYGHTHQQDCYQEEDGLWVMNPGSCGYGGGTAGLLEIENGKIKMCRIVNAGDLEEIR